MHLPNPLRAAWIAGMMFLLACGAGGQTPPSPNPSAPQPSTPLSSADPVVHKGLFTIDAVVTDAAGKPILDLPPPDLTLLDNGQPARIRTVHLSRAPSEPPPELIFIVDTINLSPQQLAQTESALFHFLLRNNGHLEYPCFLYRLTRDGLFSSLRPLTDVTLLVKELEHQRSQLPLWSADSWGKSFSGSWDSGVPRNQLSVRALGSIAIQQRDVPGRKLLVWIGPGWPVVGGGENEFDEITELSTRLREARITLQNINPWLNPVPTFNYRDHLDAPRSQKEMQPANMALQVIAMHTGGLVLDSSEDLDEDIARCAKEVQSFYTLTFNPPHTYTVDEYHDLRVELRAGTARPSMTVRALTGYYNEPVYFDNPRPGVEKVTVAQLEQLVHSQTDLLRKLASLELVERISTPRLDALLNVVHGERERQALTADADLSIALAPPPDDILKRPPPPLEEQRAILRRTFDYLQNAIPKLPDFYASRNTTRFEEPAERDNESWKQSHHDQTLHFATGEHATVRYRNGNEMVEQKKKLGKRPVVRGVRARSLETSGTFGPILSYVWTAAASSRGTLKWQRWERSKYGDVAVFSYSAASPNVGPDITYCCLPQGNGTTPYQNKADSYGEFAVNPDTGAIMRIVINADLDEERDPDVPLIRSQIIVEYGPEELGGKTYICPHRSVEISRGRSVRELHEWGMSFSLYSYFETMINDVTFGGYHKFGSESRILPGFEQTE
ncbi:MAG TPA: VWA domain-containing protein [Terracidiphilus sp.]